MVFLEEEVKRLGAENARLSALLHQRAAGTAPAAVTAATTASGGSCGTAAQGPPSPAPLSLGPAPATFTALAALLPHAAVLASTIDDQGSAEPSSSLQQLAAAPVTAACPDPAAGPPPLPPLEEQHEGLGQLLEGLPGLDVATADAYMQAWLQMPDAARTCHLRTLMRRVAAGRTSDAVSWVQTAARPAAGVPPAATINAASLPASLAQPATVQP